MKYTWIDEYLLSLKGTKKDFKAEWNWERYMLLDKMFAAICYNDDNQPMLITLKLPPQEGEFLRRQYADIIPGYYMNKVHWNSIKVDGNVPDDLVKSMLTTSYELILHGFSKKKQLEITANA